MKALLLVAHGSRRIQSNDEVIALAEKLQGHCNDEYATVEAAFLELAEPLIPEGIQNCISEGADSVIVLPYFLNSGRHVTEDIPKIVEDSRSIHPNVEITIAPHLGQSEQMINLLITAANGVSK